MRELSVKCHGEAVLFHGLDSGCYFPPIHSNQLFSLVILLESFALKLAPFASYPSRASPHQPSRGQARGDRELVGFWPLNFSLLSFSKTSAVA